MKRLLCLLAAVVMLGNALTLPALAAPEQNPTIRIRGVVWFVSSMNLYGIMSSDGKKYHPTRKLPNEFMKDGLEVVVEGRIRDDLVGERMWGKIFEVVKITKASQYIGPEDKEAVKLLLQRMDAFNNKDLAKLQTIDVVARGLTPEQFDSWLFDNGNFTLHYVETEPEANPVLAASTIRGYCLYSRQHLSSMSIFNKTNYSVMKFTLSKIDGGWKFTDTSNYIPDSSVDLDQYIGQLLDSAREKYGTTNLATWKG